MLEFDSMLFKTCIPSLAFFSRAIHFGLLRTLYKTCGHEDAQIFGGAFYQMIISSLKDHLIQKLIASSNFTRILIISLCW